MKNSILILSLIFLTSLCAAQDHDFFVKNNYITWQGNFETDIQPEELIELINDSPALRGLSNSLNGRTAPISKNCNQKGTAIFMRNEFDCYARITITESGYTVVLDDIRFFPSETWRVGGVETTDKSIKIETYLLRKKDNTIRGNRQAQTDLLCLNETFKSLFDFRSRD